MKSLKVQRVIKGFTQFDIFLKVGIAQPRLSLIENGYILPKEDEKQKLAKVLKCKVEEIFPENGSEVSKDRKRAYHLGMTYEDYSKRKSELMRQAEELKGAETV